MKEQKDFATAEEYRVYLRSETSKNWARAERLWKMATWLWCLVILIQLVNIGALVWRYVFR